MEPSLQHTADQLKSALREKPAANLLRVMAFVRKYDTSKRRFHEVIVLNRRFTAAATEEEKNGIVEELSGLIDAIAISSEVAVVVPEPAEAPFPEELPEPQPLVLQARGLNKSFKKGNFRLEDIDLALHLGEIQGLVGENANGKTTLCRLLAGELQPDKGLLTFPLFQETEKEKLNWHVLRKHIAYLPQTLPRWYGSLKANIQFEAAMHGVRGNDNILETNFIIQRFDLEEHLEKDWDDLSGGFKLRFALAKALVWKPKLLIIDEPLAHLDIHAQQIVLNDLNRLARSPRYPVAVFISSQHLHEVESIADKILFLRKGRAVFYGSPHEIGTAGAQKNVFELGTSDNLPTLRAKLGAFPDIDIQDKGTQFILLTPAAMTYRQLLPILLSAWVDIRYFRDISSSVKRLFETYREP